MDNPRAALPGWCSASGRWSRNRPSKPSPRRLSDVGLKTSGTGAERSSEYRFNPCENRLMPSQNAQQIPDEREVGTRPSFHHVSIVLLKRANIDLGAHSQVNARLSNVAAGEFRCQGEDDHGRPSAVEALPVTSQFERWAKMVAQRHGTVLRAVIVSAGSRALPARRIALGAAGLENSFVVPDAVLADVPAALRAPADPPPRGGGGGEQAEPRERS